MCIRDSSGNMEHLQIQFDCMGVYDNTYVGILQTAYASGLKEFPMPLSLIHIYKYVFYLYKIFHYTEAIRKEKREFSMKEDALWSFWRMQNGSLGS